MRHGLGAISTTGALVSGSSYDVSVGVTLPAHIYGSFYIYVLTDATASVYEHVFEDNNSLRQEQPLSVILTPPPDLTVSALSADTSASSGGPLNLSWTVTNVGAGPTEIASWSDRVYLSQDPELNSSNATLLGSVSHSGVLAAGGNYDVDTQVTLPQAISGDYCIFVVTDAYNQVFEYLAEYNNTAGTTSTIHVDLTPPPDHVVTQVTIPATAISGTSLNIQWTVENQGAGEAFEPNWRDRLYLSTDAAFDPATAIVLETFTQTGPLVVGGSYSRGYDYPIPLGFSGTYYVHVETDSESEVFEGAGEGNNISVSETQVDIALAASADLQVTAVVAPESATAGEQIAISFTVSNQGVGVSNSANWVDRVYISTSDVWTGSGALLKSIPHFGPLGPAEAYSQTAHVNIPNDYEGDYYFHVVTDVENDIYEHDAEGNNVGQSDTFTVLPYPPVDLTVEILDVSGSASSGNGIDVSWTVTNDGDARTLSSSWQDKFYLSEDASLDVGLDMPLRGFSHSGALDAAEQYSRSAAVTLPHGIAGDYYLIAKTDDGDDVSEADEANNIDAVAISVELTPPPDLQIVAFEIADEGISGQPLSVSWTVRNLGTGPADTSSWYDAVCLSTDEVLDSRDPCLGTVLHSGVLAADEKYAASTEVDLPVYAEGVYWVLVKTDSRDDIYEHNAEDNNVVSQPIVISMPPPADLIVTDIIVPETAAPGDLVAISWTVENQGLYPAVRDDAGGRLHLGRCQLGVHGPDAGNRHQEHRYRSWRRSDDEHEGGCQPVVRG